MNEERNGDGEGNDEDDEDEQVEEKEKNRKQKRNPKGNEILFISGKPEGDEGIYMTRTTTLKNWKEEKKFGSDFNYNYNFNVVVVFYSFFILFLIFHSPFWFQLSLQLYQILMFSCGVESQFPIYADRAYFYRKV